MKNFTPNQELYEKMKVPFDSEETLKNNMDAMFNDIKAIREKYKIENMTVLVDGSVMADGEEKRFITGFTLGDINQEERILNHAYRKAVKNTVCRELEEHLSS